MSELIEEIEKRLDVNCQNDDLYYQAFTHPSYVNDHRSHLKHYERLEFLGDAVIELAVSRYLFAKYSYESEGELTKMRAASVRAETLAQAMRQTNLLPLVRLGKGELNTGAIHRDTLQCDIFEALIGAIYLDLGMKTVYQVLSQFLFPMIDAGDFSHGMDYKSALQEFLQKEGDIQIVYQVIREEGPDHDKEFFVQVQVEADILGHGHGSSKKKAEQEAAREALSQLKFDGLIGKEI